jgi:hypothetical protein
VRSRPQPIVIVHAGRLWYGDDLVRNDPYLARPIVLRADALAPAAIAEIRRVFPGQVGEVTEDELLRLGLAPTAGARP